MSICFYSALDPALTISAQLFGIQDQNMQKATLKDTDLDQCECIVKNKNGTTYNFTPIDKLLILKRPDGTDDKRCDAMLFIQNKIILFIELKKKNWKDSEDNILDDYAAEGLEQLKSTISHFKKHHNDDYKNRKIIKQAHLTNINNPYFEFQDTKFIDEFEEETNFILFTAREIIAE